MIRTTQAQAAHFVLRKNYLASEQAAELLPLVRYLIGLPGEPDGVPFLAARARLPSFTPTQLRAALYQEHTLLKSVLMRSASYIILTEQYPTWYAATMRQRNQDANSEFRLWGLEATEVEQLEKAILAVLDNQPATAASIAGWLSPALVRGLSQTSRGGRVTRTTTVALVLRWLAAKGMIGESPGVTKEPSTLENSTTLDQQTYAPLNYWYPNLNLAAAPSEAEAQAELVRAYLAAFGPATEADISFWTGFGKSETARAVGALASQTTLTMVEGIPGMLLLLKEQAEALQTTSLPSEPIINILPADDSYTTAHRASRSRYFSDQKLQRLVFDSSGAAQPTVVVNGQIVGTWKLAENQPTWELLAEVDPALQPLIQNEIERVNEFIQRWKIRDG